MADDFFKKTIIILYKAIFKLVYNIMTIIKKYNDKKAVFVLSRGNELEGNLRYIHNELINQLEGVEIHFVYAENKMNLNLFKEIIAICDAKYLVLDDYYLPVYIIEPSHRLKIIQLWHGAGAFKKFGYSTIGTKFGPKNNYLKLIPVHSNYTHVYVSSKNTLPFYADAFNMSSLKIYPIGIPRVDLFSNDTEMREVNHKLTLACPILKEKEFINILVAPTYRAKGAQKESDINIIDVISSINKCIKKEVRFFIKTHPYMSKKELIDLEKHPNIVFANKYSLNEWMLIADAFITDYSSSIFDFSLLERPLAHYVPDIFEYTKNRGLYQEIWKISDGTIITNKRNLINWINSRKKDEYFDTSRMVQYNFENTQNVSEKIVTHFILS